MLLLKLWNFWEKLFQFEKYIYIKCHTHPLKRIIIMLVLFEINLLVRDFFFFAFYNLSKTLLSIDYKFYVPYNKYRHTSTQIHKNNPETRRTGFHWNRTKMNKKNSETRTYKNNLFIIQNWTIEYTIRSFISGILASHLKKKLFKKK